MLILNYNKIGDLPRKVFHHMPHLEEVRLDDSELSHLQEETFFEASQPP